MNVLVYGGGGREHALAEKIQLSPLCRQLFVWPGNAVTRELYNVIKCPEGGSKEDFVDACRKANVELIVFGPEAPLAAGMSTFCQKAGIRTFGPCRKGAELEANKAYAKSVMQSAGIPTAAYAVYGEREDLLVESKKLLSQGKQVVLKASGLAGGKGVFICDNESSLTDAAYHLYESTMKQAAQEVVLEEFLYGRECSHFALVHDNKPVSLGFAVDFKRLNNNDEGPNTGGMGAYTPVNWLPMDAEKQVVSRIIDPLMQELSKRQINYTGFLYTGLMWQDDGPKVIEFNVRLGDPEAQVICLADKRDWLPIIAGLKTEFETSQVCKPTVGIVLTSDGYPFSAPSKAAGEIPTGLLKQSQSKVYTAAVSEGKLKQSFKSGAGRVMCVVASDEDLAHARSLAYQHVASICSYWPGANYRTDIAERAVDESV